MTRAVALLVLKECKRRNGKAGPREAVRSNAIVALTNEAESREAVWSNAIVALTNEAESREAVWLNAFAAV